MINWENIALPFLKIINSYFNHESKKKNKKVHVLIVEGDTDERFLFNFLNYDFLNENTKIRLNTREDQIKSSPSHKNTPDSFYSEPYYQYDAVINCIEKYVEKEEQLEYIDCFGIIDKDYGHQFNNNHPICCSKMHDSEANMLRQYLPQYFDLSKSEDKIDDIQMFSYIVDFCLKQGILAKTANNVKTDNKLLRNYFLKISISDFKNLIKMENMIGFGFDEYLESTLDANNRNSFARYIKYKTHLGSEYYSMVEEYKKELPLFLIAFHDNLKKIYTFENELIDIFKRVVIDKKPQTDKEPNDLKRLDRIFELTNGHFLLEQMRINGLVFFDNLDSKDYEIDFVKNFSEKIIKKNPFALYEIDPLLKYKKYRIDKEYFVKV